MTVKSLEHPITQGTIDYYRQPVLGALTFADIFIKDPDPENLPPKGIANGLELACYNYCPSFGTAACKILQLTETRQRSTINLARGACLDSTVFNKQADCKVLP